MALRSRRWDPARRTAAYRELEHPADLLLEIRGRDLAELYENALFAFYDQSVDLSGLAPRREVLITAEGDAADVALRNLLAEALFRFATEGFVGTEAHVSVRGCGAVEPRGAAPPAPGGPARDEAVQVAVTLRGENVDPDRHTVLAEIKAVTYHGLSVEPAGTGWRATVLFDV